MNNLNCIIQNQEMPVKVAYGIGTIFKIPRHSGVYIITDILKIYNNEKTLVGLRYIGKIDFGSHCYESHFSEGTITKGLICKK